MTRVLAISSSPRMERGNTALILSPFLEGMREEGAEVELFYTRELTVNPCRGDFVCWLKTPGRCWQQDDMQVLLPRMCQADIWVFATPLYVDGVSGPMKNLWDRMLPVLYPFFEMRDGHCRHPLREEAHRGKVVLVSNCGFWEMDSFEPVLAHVRAACLNWMREFAGALLRPHGEALRPMLEMGAPVGDVLEASHEAGRQLVRDGEMSAQTLATVSRELLPVDMYIQVANQGFQRELERG